jgi:hypothetical protein
MVVGFITTCAISAYHHARVKITLSIMLGIIFLLEEEVISRDLCSAKYSFRELLTKY